MPHSSLLRLSPIPPEALLPLKKCCFTWRLACTCDVRVYDYKWAVCGPVLSEEVKDLLILWQTWKMTYVEHCYVHLSFGACLD